MCVMVILKYISALCFEKSRLRFSVKHLASGGDRMRSLHKKRNKGFSIFFIVFVVMLTGNQAH